MSRFEVSGSSLLAALLVTAPILAVAQTDPVVIDGLDAEWTAAAPVYSDSGADGSSEANFGRLWSGSDPSFLFLAVEFGVEVNLQSDNDLRLYLDTDLNAGTGQSFSGIGAELVWNFGDRSGRFRSGSVTENVSHDDIGLVTAPTVTSDFFEIALRLDAVPGDVAPLFPSDSVRVVLAHGTGGDRLPDAGTVVTLPIDRSTATRYGTVNLEKANASEIRIMTQNVEDDGLFAPGFTNAYSRILQGVAPDIIAFQEIRDFSVQQTVDRIEALYPAGDGETWHGAGGGTDIVLVSRYPITETFELQRANPNGFGNRAFRVDPGDDYPSDLMIVVAHLPCCDEDSRRQLEADEIMAFIRDAILAGTIESQMPVIITGDLNLVGDRMQLVTLLSGQIDSPAYLPSFAPDWDGSDYRDLIPLTTGTPLTYTRTGQGFSPGRLDYIIYSDAVLTAVKSFALETTELTLEQLAASGLRRSDSSISDHLPVVADFRFGTDTAVEDVLPGASGPDLIRSLFPNPARERLTLMLNHTVQDRVIIEIVDMLGRIVGKPIVITHDVGEKQTISTDGLADGVYLVRARTDQRQDAALFVVRHH